MAITLASLAESYLTSTERNVLRSIYRMNAVMEGHSTLLKIKSIAVESSKVSLTLDKQIKQLEEFLIHDLQNILITTKVPASPRAAKALNAEVGEV